MYLYDINFVLLSTNFALVVSLFEVRRYLLTVVGEHLFFFNFCLELSIRSYAYLDYISTSFLLVN
jgi:hypothetical protein